MRTLDRYVLSSFFVPFLYAFVGFIAIWLVFDLGDRGPDFIDAKVPPVRVLYYYGTQLPQVLVICLPVSLMLALLYSLSRLSRSNEIISMLGAGLSVGRIIAPLIGVGALVTLASMGLNYSWAPHSEAARKSVFNEIVRGSAGDKTIGAQLFRNRSAARTWYVQRMAFDSNTLEGLHITQQDTDGNIATKYYARRATYDPARGVWELVDGKTVTFDKDGNQIGEKYHDTLVVTDWPETPWRIASSNLDAEKLSVPELRDYLRFNSDFPRTQLAPYRTQLLYRYALPCACFIVVFISAPLGIVFSRRGVLVGVASSIFIFFGMLFLTNLFLALGKGDRVPPFVAAWGPNLFFFLLGLFLLHIRSANREISLFAPRAPKLKI
jgi:LPS export ABC transporter permease LptG